MSYGFKIRDRLTGMYACGGRNNWSKKGKLWGRLQDLKAHLNSMYWSHEIKPQWEIIVFAPVPNTNLPVTEVLIGVTKEADFIKLAFDQYVEAESTKQDKNTPP